MDKRDTPLRREVEPPEISPDLPKKAPTPCTEVVCGDPDTATEMVNAYGTYEIQPTSDTDYPFPAISQGLPSEEVEHRPEHFHEGLVPKLNE